MWPDLHEDEKVFKTRCTEAGQQKKKRKEFGEKRRRLVAMASAAVAKGTGMKKGQGEAHATLTSAQGLIALLDEDDDRLRAHALKQLDRVVPDLWFEVSSSIATIEALYEDESFTERSLAALLASKVRLGSAEASSG